MPIKHRSRRRSLSIYLMIIMVPFYRGTPPYLPRHGAPAACCLLPVPPGGRLVFILVHFAPCPCQRGVPLSHPVTTYMGLFLGGRQEESTLEEAAVLSKMSHQSIVRLLEFESLPHYHFLVLEVSLDPRSPRRCKKKLNRTKPRWKQAI